MPDNKIFTSNLSSKLTVQTAYIAYYGRPADSAGLEFWSSVIDESGGNTGKMIRSFGQSDEFTQQYGHLSAEQLVNNLYQQLFNRDADTAGLSYYTSVLTSGDSNLASIALEIAMGAQGSDLQTLDNKRASAEHFTSIIEGQSKYYGRDQIHIAKQILADVSDSDISLQISYSLWQREIEKFPDEGLAEIKGEGRTVFTFEGDDTKFSIFDSPASGESFDALSMESNDVIRLDEFQNDSRFQNIDGSGYSIVILDTGIDLNHPFFGADRDRDGVADRIIFSADFTNESDGTANDEQGHGSNVASIAASSDPNYMGIAPGVSIIALQVLDAAGSGNSASLERALQWVANNANAYNIAAVNMSLGFKSNNNSALSLYGLGDELQALADRNVLTISAAGNDYYEFQDEGLSYPAADPNTVSVGATFDGNIGDLSWRSGAEAYSTGPDQVAPFSQRSSNLLDIFAPGAIIEGASPGGGVSGMSGTSQAAPHIAGAAVLAQQLAQQELGRSLSPDEFVSLMQQSGVQIIDGDDEDDNVSHTFDTYHRLDIMALAEAIYDLGQDSNGNQPDQQDNIPGNPSSETTLYASDSIDGTIDFESDQDWYKITLTSGTQYQFDLVGNGEPAITDPWLALHDKNGTFIVSDDDDGTGLNSHIEFIAQYTGTYYLSAEAFGEETGQYRLLSSLEQSNREESDTIRGDIQSRSRLDLRSGHGDWPNESIDFPGDQDWWRQHLEAGKQYTIHLKGASSYSGTLQDPLIKMFDSTGSEIARDIDSGTGSDAMLVYIPTRDETIFIAAQASSSHDTGSYTIEIFVEDAENDNIPGNTLSRYEVDATGFSVDSQIDFNGDSDWFRVQLNENTFYTFSVEEGRLRSELHDPQIAIYDENGELQLMVDDSLGSLGASANYTPSTSGTFYIAVSARDTGDLGTYTLTGEAAVADDYSSHSPQAFHLKPGKLVSGNIEIPNDEDWFAFLPEAGKYYTFHATGIGSGAGTLVDPQIHFYDAYREPLNEHIHDGGNGLDDAITRYFPNDTPIFVSVTSSDVGSYFVLATEEMEPEDDFGNDPLQHGYISVGEVLQGSIHNATDEDWFYVRIEQSGIYRISAESTGTSEGLRDPYLELLDSKGNQLGIVDDDSGVGLNSLIEVSTEGPTSTYISVTGVDGDIGDYILSLYQV